MRVLYLPDWVFQALQAQGHARRDVLDEKVLLSILSGDDVAFLSVVQEKIRTVVPESILDTFCENSGGWWPCPPDGLPSDVMDRIIEYRAVGTPEPFHTPYSNLGVEMMNEDTLVFFPVLSRSKLAQMDDMGEPTVVQSRPAKLALLDRTIQAVYGFLAYPDLALTPMMRDFLLTTQAVAGG